MFTLFPRPILHDSSVLYIPLWCYCRVRFTLMARIVVQALASSPQCVTHLIV